MDLQDIVRIRNISNLKKIKLNLYIDNNNCQVYSNSFRYIKKQN